MGAVLAESSAPARTVDLQVPAHTNGRRIDPRGKSCEEDRTYATPGVGDRPEEEARVKRILCPNDASSAIRPRVRSRSASATADRMVNITFENAVAGLPARQREASLRAQRGRRPQPNVATRTPGVRSAGTEAIPSARRGSWIARAASVVPNTVQRATLRPPWPIPWPMTSIVFRVLARAACSAQRLGRLRRWWHSARSASSGS
jgi:hypothetical protein